ncbi:hypothetical protein NKH18_24290 [Streptomyces sp. M10(2022)]
MVTITTGRPAAQDSRSPRRRARGRPGTQPSALVVLLGAIALSRTYFGVLLVVSYGLGMALTLTSAGLLLAGGGSRLAKLGERRLPALRRYTPYGRS